MGVLVSFLLVVGVAVVVPGLIGYGIVGSFRLAERRRLAKGRLTCRLDINCPPGYVCRDGFCMPSTA